MLTIERVTAGYAETDVLHDVTLSVAPGQFVGLIGPNGCGKTTLLRVASGVRPARAGRVLLKGRELPAVPRRERARIMAVLSQDISLDLAYTVREIALMGRWPHLSALAPESREDIAISDHAMQLADVSRVADRLVTELSGGERQRAFIAMCLAQQPELLLLDEPTSHLDIGHQLSLLDLVRRLNRERGLTVLAVLHDLNLASEYCDRLFLMDQGRLTAEGAPQDVLTRENIQRVYQTDVLLTPNPVSGNPHVIITAARASTG